MTDRITKHRDQLRVFLLLLIPLSVVPVLAGWVGDVAKDFLDEVPLGPADPWLFLAGVVGIPALAIWVMVTGRRLFPAKIIEETHGVPARRALIALLSPCPNLDRPKDGTDASAWRIRETRPGGTEVALTGLSLDQVIDPEFRLPDGRPLPQWSWQQTLRAAHHHRDTLEDLVLIGSIGGSGTDDQLRLAQEFFSHFFPGKVRILGSTGGADGAFDSHWQADFEKLDDLTRLLQRALKELQRRPRSFTDQDIIIDCTGGQKIASIACALVTLDRPQLMFQYVGTGTRVGKVLGFNVVSAARIDD